MVLSSAMVCDHDRGFADDRRSVFLYDRRTFCDPRSSAIIWKPGFSEVNTFKLGVTFYSIRYFHIEAISSGI